MSLTLFGQGRNFSVTNHCLSYKVHCGQSAAVTAAVSLSFWGPGLPACLGIWHWCSRGLAELRGGLSVALRLIGWADLQFSKYMCVFSIKRILWRLQKSDLFDNLLETLKKCSLWSFFCLFVCFVDFLVWFDFFLVKHICLNCLVKISLILRESKQRCSVGHGVHW